MLSSIGGTTVVGRAIDGVKRSKFLLHGDP